MTDAEFFRAEFAGEPYSFWLDGWGGLSYMGCGTPEAPADSGPHVGWFTYEGEAVFIRVDRMVVRQRQPVHAALSLSGHLPHFRYLLNKREYLNRIGQCLEWIRAGESYEICLTNKIYLETDLPALDYYERLRILNPAPYSAFLSFGGTQVACSSPECFLRIDEHRRVESRPIKGTIPSDRDPRELSGNERFRAENLMIVDLVRNDLSRVCLVGSVQVPRLMEVETYATLHQLVSTITGQLKPDAGVMECIRAAFPGGSMTGAPKKRTMELLKQLEPEPRGIYSGSLGYIGINGRTDLNIVIRTAVFNQGTVSIGTGGAIVAQSDPAEEWAEMELKAQALLAAFRG